MQYFVIKFTYVFAVELLNSINASPTRTPSTMLNIQLQIKEVEEKEEEEKSVQIIRKQKQSAIKVTHYQQ